MRRVPPTPAGLRLLALALAGTALLPAVPARAQDKAPDPGDELPRFQEEVHVEGDAPSIPTLNVSALRTPAAILKTPASVSVVSEALMREQNGAVMGDVLRNAAGTYAATGYGVFDFFVIRGFDSLSSGLVLSDSTPEPEATFYPLYNLSRVEVLKGPAALLYGGNALSGAVQLVRKRPVAGRRSADASVSFGSFGTVDARLDTNLASADDSVTGRLNAVYRESDGWRDGTESRLYAANPVLGIRLGERTQLNLDLEFARSEFQPDTGLPVVGDRIAPVPRERSYQSPFDTSAQDVFRFRAELEHRFSDDFAVRGRVYYTDLDWNSDGTLVLGVLPDQTGRLQVQRTLPLLDDRQKLLGAQLEAPVSFRTGSVRHELLVGLDLLRYADEFTQEIGFLPSIDLLDPVETASVVFPIPGFTTTGDSRSIVVAPWVVDRILLSEKLELVAGARLDAIDFQDKVQGSAGDRSDTQVNPMGGIVFAPVPDLSFYATAATSFAPPSTQVVGERAPEEGFQVEAGAKLRILGGRGLLTAAWYRLEKDNIAIPQEGILSQVGDQLSRGVEAELQLQPAPGWFASAAYAYNDAELTRFAERVQIALDPPTFLELDRSGNAPPYAPRHLFNAWVSRHFDFGLSLGAGARYVGEQFISEDNAFAISDYWTADAMLAFGRGRWRAAVHFRNLTDTEYETRGFPGAAVIPGAPFSVQARIDVGLGGR